jgi:hypothetical protein
MQREKSKWRTDKGESTEAGRRDGATRSSYEVRDKRTEHPLNWKMEPSRHARKERRKGCD